MAISPFIFSSDNLPRLKAKQLSKVFPFLKLAIAQEATARALGYSSWYECTNRGTTGKPSLTDQEAGLPVRVGRYYHQAGVLMGLGIAPSEADEFVRAWGLTGQPTLAPEHAIPLYFRWNDTLERLERGVISEEQARDEWDEGIYSKYPHVDRPQRVCPGVILGPCGKYPHYAVDPAINARIPIYLRGPSSLYHYEDHGNVLAEMVAGFPKTMGRGAPISKRLNRVQHEWHYGTKHPDSRKLVLPQLESAALAAPDALVVISQRAMPTPGNSYAFDRTALACLRGRDFAAFLKAKGVIDPAKVIWYRNVEAQQFNFNLIWDMGFDDGDLELPVFVDATKYQPSLPLYSYPFMAAPMDSDEYAGIAEHICLLPLDEDYSDGGDDADDGRSDDDDSGGGSAPLEEAHKV